MTGAYTVTDPPAPPLGIWLAFTTVNVSVSPSPTTVIPFAL